MRMARYLGHLVHFVPWRAPWTLASTMPIDGKSSSLDVECSRKHFSSYILLSVRRDSLLKQKTKALSGLTQVPAIDDWRLYR
jgi:hypothetical protein